MIQMNLYKLPKSQSFVSGEVIGHRKSKITNLRSNFVQKMHIQEDIASSISTRREMERWTEEHEKNNIRGLRPTITPTPHTTHHPHPHPK